MSSIWPRPSFRSHMILTVAQNVFLAQHAHGVLGIRKAKAHVHLHPADGGQVVAVGVEEQAAEQRLGRLRRRRLAGAHDAVDVDQRVVAVGVLVHRQRVADPRAVALVDRQRRQLVDAGLFQRGEPRLGQFLAGLGIDLAGLRVDQVLGDEAAEQIGARRPALPWSSRRSSRLARGQLGLGLGHHLAGIGVDQRSPTASAAERFRDRTGAPSPSACGRTRTWP